MDIKSWLLGCIALGFCSSALSGVFKDEVDRASGSRSVGWMAVPKKDGDFTLSTFAFFPEGARAPTAYILDLLTWSKGVGLGDCHRSYWLLDGHPVGEEFRYSVTHAETELIEHFSLSTDRQTVERFANAKKIEFIVCNSKSEVSGADHGGLRRVLTTTEVHQPDQEQNED
jgi:hypothetical protein